MFFCCSAKSKKNKKPEPPTTKTADIQSYSASADLKDMVFVAGRGWIHKPKDAKNEEREKITPKPIENNNLDAEEKEDALDMLQGLADTEKKQDPILEKRLKEVKKRFDGSDLLQNKRNLHEVKIVRNTLLAGDQAPLDELAE